MSDPKIALSATRIKTAQSCSWLYHCRYVLGLPDTGNDGSSRGSICHTILEVLGAPKRQKQLAKILKAKNLFVEKSIERLVRKHAKVLNVNDDANIDLIKQMTLNGLSYDFLGKQIGKPTEALSEKDFEIIINNGDKRYKIKGFIDKLFLYKGKKFALIRDFKSSKQVFKGKEVSDNLQDYMYCLAAKHLYPQYINRQSEFLFLKFELENEDSSGVIKMAPITDEDLEGFEYQLTAIQDYLDNFNSEDALSNLAARQPYPSDNSFSGPLQCGRAKYKGELKKDGTVMWHCPYKFGFDYYAVLKDGKTIKTYFKEDFRRSFIPEGCTFEKRTYQGCPHWKRS